MSTSVRYFLIILSSIASLLTEPAYGQDIARFCSQKDSTIFFGNGVWKPKWQAKIDLGNFENVVSSIYSAEEFQKIDFDLAYNTTALFGVADLFESFIQDISTDATAFWRSLAGLIPMPTSLQATILNFATLIDKAALLSNQDLSTQVTAYQKSILEGKKVIVVSHSQGNFFANQAHGNLSSSEKNSFGIVSVANPDSFVAGEDPPIYTTLCEDFIWGIPGALVFNVINNPAECDPSPLTTPNVSAHNFIESYLAPNSNSESQILSDIVSVRAGLSPPANTAGQGIITVTLTWGPQPDVDLHAFEPNGAHVYYANLVGPSGFLDVDDVTSFGPEHYFVGCDTLETGNYRIGVNYFRGSAPEVANVLIQAGLNSRGSSVFLPTALGFSGDANPKAVGTIVVTGSRQNGFGFDIQ